MATIFSWNLYQGKIYIMLKLTRWTWVWVNSGSWWWTGRPGVLQFMGSQRVGHNWVTELNWTDTSKDQTQCVPSPPGLCITAWGLSTHSAHRYLQSTCVCQAPCLPLNALRPLALSLRMKLLLAGTPRMVANTQDSDCFQAFCPWASPVTAEHEAEEGTTVLPSMEGSVGGC